MQASTVARIQGNLIDGKRISSEMCMYGSTMLCTRARKFSISIESKTVSTSNLRFKSSKGEFHVKGIWHKVMLAPRSAKVLHEKALLKLHGMRILLGSPSFGGTLL
nr:hypothetical protein [Tanacetum cinerariifolium]